jgi:hypothetical protein
MMSEYNSLVVMSDLLQKPLNGVFVANMFAGLRAEVRRQGNERVLGLFRRRQFGGPGPFGSLEFVQCRQHSYFSSFVKAPSAAYWALYAAQNLWINPEKQNTLVAGLSAAPITSGPTE